MFVGENVTDDTKDAQINNLKKQLRDIKSGDFSNAPELEAFLVGINAKSSLLRLFIISWLIIIVN